jgi:hypothetical protein
VLPGHAVLRALLDYYRAPDTLFGPVSVSNSTRDVGFFRFGPGAICYGQCATGVSKKIECAQLPDASLGVRFDGPKIDLPFDPEQVIENLRHERYMADLAPGIQGIATREWVRKSYYLVRALLPVWIRRHPQRAYFSDWQTRPFPAWPVDFTVDTLHEEFLRLSMSAAGLQRVPFIWFWPDGAPNCLIMTHDVETRAGKDFTSQLMEMDESYGIRASFQVIPENRYQVSDEYVNEIRARGFEFNIHDLNHDGNLYRKREEFLRRAKKINDYGRRYNARGFRAGSMYRMLDWYDAYEFSYDMSLTSVAHLEPKRGGCCTVFPFFIGKVLELPLTTSQDYSVFHILGQYSIDLWEKQLDIIGRKNGLISFISHPDYLHDRKARKVYKMLLGHLRRMIDGEKVWMALPGELDQWWRARSQMKLVEIGGEWRILGLGAENARIAFAVEKGDRLVYELTRTASHQ